MAVDFGDIVIADNDILGLSGKEVWSKVVAQISKDLIWEEIPFAYSGDVGKAYKDLKELLNGWITHYMERNPEVLAQALYRVDVPEHALAKAEANYPELLPSEIMAHAILRRTIQKIILRQRYSQKQG